ncbi:MAG: ABC transporter ATP-binding protein [Lachnospiraceae bacterium]|nr:ABC transporter ATP-binding protein [Lachnospiraceae bacterium]
MSEITLKGVSRVYGKKTRALDKIDLTICNGEFIVLLGPSGCGKTTFLRAISGIERPDEGDILFDGVSVLDKKPQERNCAMVFQNFALYPHMTVYKNIAYPLASRKMPKDEIDRKVRKIAEVFRITPLLEKRPRVLSGGQRQLVAVARSLVRDPDVFLLDEPFSNLDAETRDILRSEVRRAHALHPKTPFIYVTHDQTEAMNLSDRIAVMHAGRITMCGTPAEIYDRPADIFTAQFFGNPKMNLMPGMLTGSGDDCILAAGGGTVRIGTGDAGPGGQRKVLLGVRPEKIRVPENETGAGGMGNDDVLRINATALGKARLGMGEQLLFSINGAEGEFSAVPEEMPAWECGQQKTVIVLKKDILLYDPESGQRIL